MNDIEKQLRGLPIAEPPGSLDAKMDQVFANAPVHRRPWLSHPVALWQCTVACAACLLIGFLAQHYIAEPPEPIETTNTVYIIPATPEMQRAFNATPTQSAPPRIIVETASRQEGAT